MRSPCVITVLLVVLLAVLTDAATARPRRKESQCTGSQIVDVGAFVGDGPFRVDDVARLKKAVVRIRVTSTERAREIFEASPLAKKADKNSFAMGGWSSLANANQGICTGTLIDGNIVVTAGHCIWPSFWKSLVGGEDETAIPYYRVKGDPVGVDEDMLAKLLVVDFNYEADYSVVASATDLSPRPNRPPVAFTVRELIATDRTTSGDRLDYSILRIRGTPQQIGDYALGPGHLDFSEPKVGYRVIAIQHYEGLEKKLATGAVVRTYRGKRGPMFEHVISTTEGSSGSSVIGSNGKIVGIHTDGGCDDPSYQTNNGVLLKSIEKPLKRALGIE